MPPVIAAMVPLPNSDFSSPKRIVTRRHDRAAARLLRQQRPYLIPPGSVPVTMRASMFAGVGSNVSPCAIVARALVILRASSAISGAAGISARSGFLVGMNVPSVRLDSLRYALATRSTSASVTALNAVAHQEEQPPIALRRPLAQVQRHFLRIRHLQFDLLQQARLHALHFFLAGRLR